MYCVCYLCGIQYRVKPPLEEDGISHGLCDGCFPLEMQRIEREMAKLER